VNILQILPELNVGGVETGTVDLARYLVKQGHKAVVVSHGGGLVKDLEACGAIHYQLPVHQKSLFSILKMIPQLSQIIIKEEIDIVHARSRAPAWIAFFAARKTNRVFITTCHGYYRRHFFSRVMGWGKLIICPSQALARYMLENFQVPHERLRLIPRSVDLEKFKFIDPAKKRREIFHVGIIGRLTPIKGHIYFLKAMAKVIRSWPRIKIWVVGDAASSKESYKEEIHIMVRRLGLSHCTEFLGTQKDIPEIMSNLDLLVMASTYPESFGRVIIEAQAAGVPVIATEVGGIVDIIENNVNGLLVAPKEPQGMSEAIIRIIKDVKLVSRLAENAYKKVKAKYNLELMAGSTLNVYKEALSSFKILVIKMSSLGDVVISTAALRAIRQRFKEASKISLLVGSAAKDVVIRCPYIDDLIVYDLNNRNPAAMWKMARELRRHNFDMVIDLQNNRLSHKLSRLSLAAHRYGYNNGKLGFLLNHQIKDDKLPIDPVSHQFRILKMLDIDLTDSRLEVWPSQQDEVFIDESLSANWAGKQIPLVGINISASARWQSKAWPQEKIIKLCEALALKDMRVVLTGTTDDSPAAKSIVNLIKSAKPIIACGKTSLNQLACLIRRCKVFISPDSAPLHLACAVDTPFIALFGPTDARRHLAAGAKGIVLNKNMLCSPCYKPKCRRKDCMEKISVENVLEAIAKLLE
jgi:lipopolysaccharide heptosyltransferase II